MPALPDDTPALPLDAQSILELAARSMFQLFSSVSQGMFLVDRTCRIVWVNEGYQRFLPDLGFSSLDQFLGRTVEEVIPNTQMRRVLETGQPVLIDLLTNKAGTFVVSRIPLRDEADRGRRPGWRPDGRRGDPQHPDAPRARNRPAGAD